MAAAENGAENASVGANSEKAGGGAGLLKVDAATFMERAKRLLKRWTKQKPDWNDADALLFTYGKANDGYSKSLAMQYHFFGTQIPNMMLAVVPGAIHIVASPDVCEQIKSVVRDDAEVKINLVPYEKESGAATMEELLKVIKGAAAVANGDSSKAEEGEEGASAAAKKVKVGVPIKDEAKGPFVDAWNGVCTEEEVERVDVSLPLGVLLAVKDELAAKAMDNASTVTSRIFKKVLIQRIEDVIDEDKPIKHSALADEIEKVISDPSTILPKVAPGVVDSCYFPIIQSGGKYDIRANAESNDDDMKFDVVLCSMGTSYKGYCSNMSRTILIDPPQKVQEAYKTLVSLYEACLDAVKPGEPLKSVMEKAKAFLESKAPDFLPYLPKNLGSVIGVEFRDPALLLNAKNSAIFRPGMYLNLVVGFSNIPLSPQDRKRAKKGSAASKLETFSLLLADTVRVLEAGKGSTEEKLVTKHDYKLAKVMWEIGDDDKMDQDGGDEDDDVEEVQEEKPAVSVRGGRALRERKGEQENGLSQAEIDKKMHELVLRKMKEKAAKAGSRKKTDEAETESKVEELQAYSSTDQYPRDMRPHQIFVDMERESVLLPIHGMHVPFHISTIKNVVQPEPDQSASYLRINFFTPGQTLGKDVPAVMSKLIAKHGQNYGFIKEMLFRSLDQKNINMAFRHIQELRKRARQREKTEKEEADIVEQDKLITLKNQKVPRLVDLIMRPVLSGRKTIGMLEAHANGLRFRSKKGEVVDIMYNNIRHAVFHPCKGTINVVIHFHLKDPIMINKKKAQDVQFYTEVVEAVISMEGTRRSNYDPDEIEEEQREKELRKRLNESFRDFCQKVVAVAEAHEQNMDFEVPYDKLWFMGTPHKEMVKIWFSPHCLLNVSEVPFFVVCVEDIEHVHFERVMPSSRNFDMVIIQKDLSKDPVVINAIPREHLIKIEQTLLEMDVTFTYGAQTWKWRPILDEAKDNPTFYHDKDEEGEKKFPGWALFLENGGDDDEEGSGQESEDDDSEYEQESESEEEEDDESDYEEDEDEDDDDESDEEDEEEDYDEADWDRQEAKLAAEERAKKSYEEENPKLKKRGPPPPKKGLPSNKKFRR